MTLETGELSPDGLSPADAAPLVLTALAEGRQLSAGEQKLGWEETVFLELANQSLRMRDNRVLCWLEKSDGALRRAEVLSAGMTVVTLFFGIYLYI